MAGIRGFRRAVALMAALGAAVAGGLAATPQASAEGAPVITWPTITALNPTTTSYPVTASYDGPDHLFLTMRRSPSLPPMMPAQPLPSTGSADAAFPEGFDGTLSLVPALCPTETYAEESCTLVVAEYRWVSIADEFVPELGYDQPRSPQSPLGIHVWPSGAGDVQVDWQVLALDAPDGAPLVAGSADLGVPQEYESLPPIGPTEALVHGHQYLLRATFEGDVDPFGHLVGTDEMRFTWDNRVAVNGFRIVLYDEYLETTVDSPEVFYPRFDYDWLDGTWRDDIRFRIAGKNNEHLKRLVLTLTNAEGQVIRHLSSTGWNGTDNAYEIVPEGRYTITLHAVDLLDNEVTYEREIGVSHDVLTWTTWTTKVSAKRSIVDRGVGRCASVTSPARASWPGSLGYRSSTAGSRCRDLEAQSAITVHRIKLPRSPLGHYERYRNVRVSAYGGGARGADKAYLVHWYWSTRGEWVGRSQFDRRLGWHRGVERDTKVVHGDPDDSPPFVIWSVGLAEGAKYDVKGFRVTAGYFDIR